MTKICKCCMCGFEWIHGRDGSHSCAEVLHKELTATKLKLASAEDECSLAHSQRRDEAHRANNAERRLSQTEVKLAFAEARVKELEGLASKVVRAWKAFDLAEGDWERTDSEMELANSIGTLGDAMPRKEGV